MNDQILTTAIKLAARFCRIPVAPLVRLTDSPVARLNRAVAVSARQFSVASRIRGMAARDPERVRFGAYTHQYELAPALPEAQIRAFEEDHGVDLPAEYRSFVAEVGNGPAGPGYGLMPLTVPRPEAEEGWALDGEWKEDRLPGRLAALFPLTEPLPGRIGAPTDELTRGTLTLAEEGCGICTRLILTGPRAGEIWQIDPDWGGFVLVSPGFRSWYAEWLQRL